MALFKCKMCGGSLEIPSGTTVIECEYCGTQQTLPKLDDDKRATLYDRANHFRRNNEFDKAMGIYEQILNEDNTDAEAYWSIVLCRYGIEYVEDPASHRRMPTVNRAQFTSILADEDYKSALANADTYQKSIYEVEAKAIDEIQKGILAISNKEEPFDVFICYKESDNFGKRTPDSVLAQDLYFGLKNEGFKVFFARITLEDKLGSAYEPYIFAALNSAKVMVVLGTKPEYFNAVWVKNEWSRYLALIKQGQKKMLIPAYKDMDPYNLPEEFSHLQAQDMSKLGFMQDLIRGIKKIVKTNEPKPTVVKETVATTSTANSSVAPLLKRAFIFLEDGDFDRADDFCEQVLNQDPENAHAYLGKLMIELRVKKQGNLKELDNPFDDNGNYKKVLRYADEQLKTTVQGYIQHIHQRIAEEQKDAVLFQAYDIMEYDYEKALKLFKSIPGWKDADEKARYCQGQLEEMEAQAEAARLEREQMAEEKRRERAAKAEIIKKTAAGKAKYIFIAAGIIAVVVAVIVIICLALPKEKGYTDGNRADIEDGSHVIPGGAGSYDTTEAGDAAGEISIPSGSDTAVTAPVAGTAYKLFTSQITLGKKLFAIAELDQNKYYKTTENARYALDFYVEIVDGGVKIYTTIDGAKKYVNAALVAKENDNTSKVLSYTDTTETVWAYKADVNAWFTTIDGGEYVLGTYGTYSTFCIYESRLITAENTGVSQFPAHFVAKDVAESYFPETPETPEQPPVETTWTLTTTLNNGDLVLIGAPNYGELLSADKVSASSYYNKGVDYRVTDFSKVTDAEIFVVTVNADNTYTFTSRTGVVIALAESYSSLDNTGVNKTWTLIDNGDNTFLVKNVARGNYLEWYSSKDCWSTYTVAYSDEYKISFYVQG